MERGGTRDINELLLNGFFKTARGKSPARPPRESSPEPVRKPSYLQPLHHEPRRERSRSRTPRGPPPPRPTVEDEKISLAKEYRGVVPSYDPPLRGIVEQNPIILEAGISDAEAARLHELPEPKEKDSRNPERRFVFVPRSDTASSNSEEDAERKKQRKRDSGKSFPKDVPHKESRGSPPLERRRTSRQDLPSLETKVPREIPPQFRRSASAFATPKADASKNAAPRTPAGEYFLSPDVMRGPKETFNPAQSAPRYASSDFGGRATPSSDNRNSGSFTTSRPTTPNSDKRNSGNFESGRRSRRNTNEKLPRPQQLAGEHSRRPDKQSERTSTARSSRSSTHSGRHYYSSSESDIADSDSERHRRRHHGNLHPEDDRHLRSTSKSSNTKRPGKPSSRYTSPLPSPKVSPSQIPIADHVERSGTFPISRRGGSRPVSPTGMPRDKLNIFDVPSTIRPTSRQSSTAPVPIPTSSQNSHNYIGALPIPIPSRIDVHSPGDTRRPVSRQGSDEKSGAQPAEKPYWQPPKFEPPTHLEKPVGSYRRFSEDIERGNVPELPICPRKTFTRGRSDWLTLPQCPGFDICPTCYNSTMLPTEFRHMFVPAPFRPPDAEVLCDFGSSPWYRIAWLLTLKERRKDLGLFYGLAKVAQSIPPCLGSHEAKRQWHSILDPKTGSPIRNFDVCSSCVKAIEVLLPAIRGIFVRTDPRLTATIPRVCDLRFDSKRFVQYFDALETTADHADYTGNPPDTRNLASIVKRFAALAECQRDIDLRDSHWHIITQLPEFTVCEECFDEVVWPELENRKKAIPLMFNKTVQRLPKASCQLYSPIMRGIFRTAVDSNDYKLLASKARERKAVEAAYKANLAELKRLSGRPNDVYGGGGGGASGYGHGSIPWVQGEIERITKEWRRWE